MSPRVVNPARQPAQTVTGPDAFGAPAAVGTRVTYAREDHDHGLPANPSPNPATTVTGPDAYGAPSVVGVLASYAREDHDHGLPAAPSATVNHHEGSIGGNVALPANATTAIMSTASLGVGKWLVEFGFAILSNTATPTTAEVTMVQGTATATFAGQQSTGGMTVSNVATSAPACGSIRAVVTVTVAGTITFNAVIPVATACNALASTSTTGLANATGYTAIQLS